MSEFRDIICYVNAHDLYLGENRYLGDRLACLNELAKAVPAEIFFKYYPKIMNAIAENDYDSLDYIMIDMAASANLILVLYVR
jgi:MinD-like ATPase involved in chromosome partitioning or flagellar assembly